MNNANALTQYQSEVIEALKSVANLGKPFEKVIIDTLKLFMAIPDKIIFLQMGRYGEFTEQRRYGQLSQLVIERPMGGLQQPASGRPLYAVVPGPFRWRGAFRKAFPAAAEAL